MTLESLAENIPGYAKDLKLNLSSVLRQSELTEQQSWGTAAACAIAARNPDLAETVLLEAQLHLSPQALEAAKIAAAIMGMNNVYYRFLHLTTNERYATIPARLRMNGIRNHGVDAADFELWCTAVSAINNCPACVAAHEKVLREKGMTEETILAAVRIASVIHAIAAVLDLEAVAPVPA
ncbi:MAG: carboxymuconolactone decarboxylase family protein [Bryobacteraceae bacterium]